VKEMVTDFVESFSFLNQMIQSMSNGLLGPQINNFQWCDTWDFNADEGLSSGFAGYDILKMKALLSSETMVFFHITIWCHNPVHQVLNFQWRLGFESMLPWVNEQRPTKYNMVTWRTVCDYSHV